MGVALHRQAVEAAVRRDMEPSGLAALLYDQQGEMERRSHRNLTQAHAGTGDEQRASRQFRDRDRQVNALAIWEVAEWRDRPSEVDGEVSGGSGGGSQIGQSPSGFTDLGQDVGQGWHSHVWSDLSMDELLGTGNGAVKRLSPITCHALWNLFRSNPPLALWQGRLGGKYLWRGLACLYHALDQTRPECLSHRLVRLRTDQIGQFVGIG